MKLLRSAFCFLLFAGCASAAQTSGIEDMDAYQNFSAGTVSNKLTATILNNSKVGTGTWSFYNSGGATNFQSWQLQSVTPLVFPHPIRVDGVIYTDTGTNCIWYDMSVNNAYEIAKFSPHGSGYQFSNTLVQGFIYLGATHFTGSQINMDHVTIYGGSFYVMEQQLSSQNGTNVIIAHAQLNGASVNGGSFAVPGTNWYYFRMLRDSVNGRGETRLYHPTTFAEVGSIGADITKDYGFLVVDFNAHYLGLPAGQTMFAGLSIKYVGTDFDIGSAWRTDPIIDTNRLPIGVYEGQRWLGVRGGIPWRTNITNAYLGGADKTMTTNAATIIQTIINGASAGDVVYFPGGKYRCSAGLVLKANISLRGDGTNSELVFLGSGAIAAGPTTLSSSQGKQFTPTNAAACVRGVTNITLTTNNFFVGATPFGTITAGEPYVLYEGNRSDDDWFAFSVYGFTGIKSQVIRIMSLTGNTITFEPPLMADMTNEPMLLQRAASMMSGVGIENLTVTLTNGPTGEYATGSFTDNIIYQNCVDSWVMGVATTWSRNYNLHFTGTMFSEVYSNVLAYSLSGGTSHNGFIMESSTAILNYNNVYNTHAVAVSHWAGSDVGCFHFANYFTNCLYSFRYHNTFHYLNVHEANVSENTVAAAGHWQMDGYSGNNAYATVFRSFLGGSISNKRFNHHNAFVGNVLGTTDFNFRYDDTVTGGSYPIFELGYPHLGDLSTNGISPPTGRTYPGTAWTGAFGSNVYHRAYSNMSWVVPSTVQNAEAIAGDFSLWPFSAGGEYVLIFQNPSNTNLYRFGVYAIVPPTSTGMVFNIPFNITNGEIMYVSSPSSYDQRQTFDNATHIRHGNWVTTNLVPNVQVWDAAIPNLSIPDSLTFNSEPSWWGTNAWPPMNGTRTKIPAEDLFETADSGGGSAPSAISGLRFGSSLRGGASIR